MTSMLPPNVKVHLALGFIDMRKGIDGLAMLVQGVPQQDPFTGHLFVFRGRTRANLIKINLLGWHRSACSPNVQGIQTVRVPAGGAVITEFKVDVPGNYTLVDHALSRMERGLVGMLHVDGPPNTEIFDGKIEPRSGH